MRHDRVDDAACDVLARLALAHQGDDLGFREYGALVGDDGGLPCCCQASKLGLAYTQSVGHDLQEAPGPRRAFIVHDELAHLAAGKADGLGVLPADIDDGAVFAEQRRRAASVAGDLGDHLVRIRHGHTAVPCGDHRHLPRPEALAGERTAHLLGHFHAGKTRGDDQLERDSARRVRDDGFRSRRSDIDADTRHVRCSLS